MFKLLPLILKSMKQKRVRTMLTIIGVSVAVFIFCFFQAIQDNMDDVISSAGAHNNLVVSESNKWWPNKSELPETYVEKLGQFPQVEEIMPIRIVSIDCCKMDPEVVIVHGIDKDKFLKFREFNVDPEVMKKFREDKTAALVGMHIARRRDWNAGQSINPLKEMDTSFTVAGVFFTGNEEQDNLVLIDLKYLQDLQDKRGWVNLIYIKVKEGENAEALAVQIDNTPLPVNTRTQPEKAFITSMMEELTAMVRLSRIVILIILLIMLISIGNTISMSVRDKTQQIGIMRTLGYTRSKIVSLVILESMIMALLGGLLGCLVLFGVFEFLGMTIQVRTYNFALNLNTSIAVMGMVVALMIGFIGSLLPAYQASRLNIVNSLRNIV